MAGNDVQIQLTAKDGASSVFKTVGRSAQDMGKQVDTAGKSSEASLSRMSKAGAVAGAAFASLGGVLSLASHANAEAEASQARLTTAIENTGDSVLDYQDQLDAASKKALQLGFDDEDAADSIAKMTTATGDAQTAINDLAIAEDIARARNIDLASATNIVIAAEQGRVGALKRVGIEVDASMSKEQVMDALRAKFAGNAEAYSTTTAAGFDRLRNSTENALESLGSHLGPANTLLMILPGLSAGFTGIGAAVGALAPEMTAATVAAGALDVAMGPVGLIGIAAAAGLAIFGFTKYLDLIHPASTEAANGVKELDDAYHQLLETQSVSLPLSIQTKNAIDYIGQAADDARARIKPYQDAVNGAAEIYAYWIQRQKDGLATSKADQASVAKATANYEAAQAALAGLNDEQEKAAVSSVDVNQARTAAAQILLDTSAAGEQSRQKLAELYAQEQAGTIGWTEYLKAIITTAAAMPELAAQIQSTGAATAAATLAVQASTAAYKAMNVQMAEYTDLLPHAIQTQRDFTQNMAGTNSAQRVMGQGFTDMADDAGSAGDALIETTRAQNESAAAAKAQAAAFSDAAEKIGFFANDLDKLIASGVSTWAERTASRVQRAGDTLGSLTSVVIDGTSAIAQQSAGVNDWAMGLINVQGVTGKIDDLYAHGQITLSTYNAAQEAGNRIFADNAAIQEDVLRIQTKQAPLIADATDAYAKYIDQVADLPPQQQLVALGWMDSNEAAKANAALALAAAAANNEYGDAGEAAATAAITAQARADPAFAAMLQDMGLISVGADGTITVNFPDNETVQESVHGLTDAVNDLITALTGVPPHIHSTVEVDGTEYATSLVRGYNALLDSINGKVVVTRVYVDAYGPGIGYQNLQQHGGVIPHAQHGAAIGGGGWSWVGEAGPELIHAPGAQVLPHTASVETSRGSGGGGPTYHINTLTVVANDPRQFSEQMRSYNFGYGARS